MSLCACSGYLAHREGLELLGNGHVEEGLKKLREATDASPANQQFRMSYLRASEQSVATWIVKAEREREAGNAAEAEQIYRRVLGIDPSNARAKAGLALLAQDARHKEWLKQAESAWQKNDVSTASGRLRDILAENPEHPGAGKLRQAIQDKLVRAPMEARLAAALKKPISIEFKDVSLKQVFEIISRSSGLNFVFDKDIRGDQKTTVFLRGTTTEDAINLVLVTNQLEQRILDQNSILIYPDTPAKAREYQTLIVKSFFLSNADVKSAANTLKTILKTKDIVVDERQNMIVMRDTADAVRLAEKLIALHDLPEPEVMLELEVIEITRSRLSELGIQWPSQLTLAPLANGTSGVTLADLRNFPSSRIGASLSPMTFNLHEQDGDIRLLANPRIRTRSRDSAKILIGDRVPNITTTATATGFVSDSVQYIDVGLKLEVQPTVFPDNEMTIKLSLEVSSIVNQVQTKSGTLAYQIGTRTASSMLRLKDGENQVLAGLINDEDRATANQIPLLGDIPILGRFFGSQRSDGKKTEILLSVTPRLVRNIQRPSLPESEFESGTEASIKKRNLENMASVAAPAAPAATSSPSLSASQPTQPIAAANPATPKTSTPGGPSPVLVPAAETIANLKLPAKVAPGETFSAVLAVQQGEPLTSALVSIGYDPKIFEPVSVSNGDLFRQGMPDSNFAHQIDRTTGQIFVTSSGPTSSTNQGGALATFAFKALVAAQQASVQVLSLSVQGADGRSVKIRLPEQSAMSIAP
jgi:general secretion pathway protein D